MKNLIFIVLILLSGGTLFAQATASATVESRATVIDPIQIDKTVDLDFGNIISTYNPGSVVLLPDGTRVAYGVQISNSMPGNVVPAEAVITHGNNSYNITLPQSFTLHHREDPNQVMLVDQFTVEPLPGITSDIIKIGGTLNLQANQLSGYYTNSSGFNVTVSYN